MRFGVVMTICVLLLASTTTLNFMAKCDYEQDVEDDRKIDEDEDHDDDF